MRTKSFLHKFIKILRFQNCLVSTLFSLLPNRYISIIHNKYSELIKNQFSNKCQAGHKKNVVSYYYEITISFHCQEHEVINVNHILLRFIFLCGFNYQLSLSLHMHKLNDLILRIENKNILLITYGIGFFRVINEAVKLKLDAW